MRRTARPTVLIAEPDPGESLSTRKLAVESAKFNVISAHSAAEATELLAGFPNLDAVILHGRLPGYHQVAETLKAAHAEKPLVFLHVRHSDDCAHADHRVSSHSPADLVELLRTTFGDPRLIPSTPLPV